MTQEQTNVKNCLPDIKPECGGHTVIARAADVEAVKLLDKVKEIWEIVASWGRFMDEELGDWPSLETCLEQLPLWFRDLLQTILTVQKTGRTCFMIGIGPGGADVISIVMSRSICR